MQKAQDHLLHPSRSVLVLDDNPIFGSVHSGTKKEANASVMKMHWLLVGTANNEQ